MMGRYYDRWCRFWFESDPYFPMRMFRPALAFILFLFYLSRTADLELFYMDTGMLTADVAREMMPMNFRASIFDLFSGPALGWAVQAAHWLLLASLLALAFGYLGRASAVVAFVLHISFLHRNMLVMFGVDMIGTFFLFLFCLSDFRPRPPVRPDFRSMLGSAAYRLAQIQVCIIYAYSGLEKLKGPLWWRGEAVWSVLANAQLARMDFAWVAHFPMLIIAATYSTLLWEIYFPVLVWFRPVRPWVLAFGAALHIGIGISINIWYFGLLMIATYLLFLERKDFDFLAQVFRPRSDKTYV